MDAFSEVLSGVRLKGAVFFHAEFSAPWVLSTPQSCALAPTLAPGSPHLLIYHYVVDGEAQASLADGRGVTLGPGDVVVLPHGDAHDLGNGAHARALDGALLLAKIAARDLAPMRAGGGGARTRFVCGFMACDPQLCAPILDGLPAILRVNVRADRAGQWLEQSLLHLVEEAGAARAGADAMLAKLSEALFVDTLRRYVAALPESQTGWLAGARDPLVGRSLALLHARSAHHWTIAELADAVGASRTVLVEHFSRYLGEAPIAYLTRWRLQLAARTLASTSRGVAAIAADVGYESEAAFNRAFKRAFGLPPARYRREHRAAMHGAYRRDREDSLEALKPAS
ncbi:MAG: AraC family transcriptional regulator [Steroidobacteraceae bacterium]